MKFNRVGSRPPTRINSKYALPCVTLHWFATTLVRMKKRKVDSFAAVAPKTPHIYQTQHVEIRDHFTRCNVRPGGESLLVAR